MTKKLIIIFLLIIVTLVTGCLEQRPCNGIILKSTYRLYEGEGGISYHFYIDTDGDNECDCQVQVPEWVSNYYYVGDYYEEGTNIPRLRGIK